MHLALPMVIPAGHVISIFVSNVFATTGDRRALTEGHAALMRDFCS